MLHRGVRLPASASASTSRRRVGGTRELVALGHWSSLSNFFELGRQLPASARRLHRTGRPYTLEFALTRALYTLVSCCTPVACISLSTSAMRLAFAYPAILALYTRMSCCTPVACISWSTSAMLHRSVRLPASASAFASTTRRHVGGARELVALAHVASDLGRQLPASALRLHGTGRPSTRVELARRISRRVFSPTPQNLRQRDDGRGGGGSGGCVCWCGGGGFSLVSQLGLLLRRHLPVCRSHGPPFPFRLVYVLVAGCDWSGRWRRRQSR
jgi:hypothetical protein